MTTFFPDYAAIVLFLYGAVVASWGLMVFVIETFVFVGIIVPLLVQVVGPNITMRLAGFIICFINVLIHDYQGFWH
jgi:hypothetical protein